MNHSCLKRIQTILSRLYLSVATWKILTKVAEQSSDRQHFVESFDDQEVRRDVRPRAELWLEIGPLLCLKINLHGFHYSFTDSNGSFQSGMIQPRQNFQILFTNLNFGDGYHTQILVQTIASHQNLAVNLVPWNDLFQTGMILSSLEWPIPD